MNKKDLEIGDIVYHEGFESEYGLIFKQITGRYNMYTVYWFNEKEVIDHIEDYLHKAEYKK